METTRLNSLPSSAFNLVILIKSIYTAEPPKSHDARPIFNTEGGDVSRMPCAARAGTAERPVGHAEADSLNQP